MAYTRVGPFTDSSASPALSAAFFNQIEDALATGWVTYYPGGNWTGGVGSTASFHFRWEAGAIRVRGRARMGTSPAIGTFLAITLPAGVTYASWGVFGANGAAVLNHAGTQYLALVTSYNAAAGGTADTTPPDSLAVYGIGTNGQSKDVSTVFAWTSGDYFELDATVPTL